MQQGQTTQRVNVGAVEVSVAVDHCVGCLACADICQSKALRLLPDVWAVTADTSRCTGCRRCMSACPFGAINVSGGTRTRHQVVMDNLCTALGSTCPAQWRVSAPGPAFWTALSQPTVVPDLAIVQAGGLAGPWQAPDHLTVPLVVEVVAPSTRDEDLGRKRELYWQRDVGTYWTVDQRTGRVTVQWSLRPAWFDRWAAFSFT